MDEIWDWCIIELLKLLNVVLKLFVILKWWLKVFIIMVEKFDISIVGIVVILNSK